MRWASSKRPARIASPTATVTFRRAQARCSVVQTATEVWRMARGPPGAGPRCQLRSASHEASRSGVAMSQPVVLVTSASGRIGKELVARLAQAGDFTVRASKPSTPRAGSATRWGPLATRSVATRDIAEAAAVVLTEGPEQHANKFYDITGPEPQTMDEIAADLGNAMGRAT
ncbi:hypothetical protein GQR58_030512 [Nymphon striatum]|nr:hypothetical protein GQR58_030512 [Nymphon striatum]